jgi:hypothetical protein
LRLVLNPTYILISLGQGMDAFIISGLSGNHHFVTSVQIYRTQGKKIKGTPSSKSFFQLFKGAVSSDLLLQVFFS